MKVLFCPPAKLGNTYEERLIENSLSIMFDDAVVDSLVFHQSDTYYDLFDLICDFDIVAFMPESIRDGIDEVDSVTMFAIRVATSIGKKVIRVNPEALTRRIDNAT